MQLLLHFYQIFIEDKLMHDSGLARDFTVFIKNMVLRSLTEYLQEEREEIALMCYVGRV